MDYNQNPQYGYNYNNQTSAMPMMISAVMKRVYFKMFLGLIVTAFMALIILEFGLVIGISAGINKLSSPMATLLFYLFAAVNGAMLSSIFLVYSPDAIVKTFFITAGTFGAMSVFGYFTSQDLSKIGSILFMALIGLIIASLVNIFLKSSGLDWIISIVGVLIFVGLTAWDTQQIKNMAMTMPGSQVGRLATIGALNLYLDFINLFLYLLRIFGDRD